MKVLFLTKYSTLGASSRYRTYQYVTYLSAKGFSCDISPLFSDQYLTDRYRHGRPSMVHVLHGFIRRLCVSLRFGHYDLVVIEKELFPYLPAFLERWILRLSPAYTLDFDDALFHVYNRHHNRLVRSLLGEKYARLMANAALVTVGNSYIKEYARHYAKRVEVLPTVIDLSKYSLSSEPDGVFTIGWIGTPNTEKYLYLIAKPLRRFLELEKGKLLLVGVSDKFKIDGISVEVLPWSEDKEVSFIQRMHVGIMPLPDLPIERGKSGLKLLQYMACNRPVIASPVGVNKEIVNQEVGYLVNSDEEWFICLLKLADDPALRKQMGSKGRLMIEERYNLLQWASRYARMLYEAAGKL